MAVALVVGMRVRSIRRAASTPPPVVVVDRAAVVPFIKGGCPFETCQYRSWTACSEVPLFDAIDGLPKGVVKKGAAVIALGGEVHAVPQEARLLEVREWGREHGFAEGDRIWLLFSFGEGAVWVWHQGEVKFLSGEGSRLSHYRKGKSTWWVQVRLPDDSTGWISADVAGDAKARALEADFVNVNAYVDSCEHLEELRRMHLQELRR